MLPYLVDLESPFYEEVKRDYYPVEVVRYALSRAAGDYWPDLALTWLEQGAPVTGLREELHAFVSEPRRPQAQRHRARRLRKSASD